MSGIVLFVVIYNFNILEKKDLQEPAKSALNQLSQNTEHEFKTLRRGTPRQIFEESWQ